MARSKNKKVRNWMAYHALTRKSAGIHKNKRGNYIRNEEVQDIEAGLDEWEEYDE